MNRRSFFGRLFAALGAAQVAPKLLEASLDASVPFIAPEHGISMRYIKSWDAEHDRVISSMDAMTGWPKTFKSKLGYHPAFPFHYDEVVPVISGTFTQIPPNNPLPPFSELFDGDDGDDGDDDDDDSEDETDEDDDSDD